MPLSGVAGSCHTSQNSLLARLAASAASSLACARGPVADVNFCLAPAFALPLLLPASGCNPPSRYRDTHSQSRLLLEQIGVVRLLIDLCKGSGSQIIF